MRSYYRWLLIATLLVAGFGCRQSESPPAESPVTAAPLPLPEPPREFSFTNRSVTVSETEVQAVLADQEHFIKADFNADGLTDLIVLENMDNGSVELAIYIQAPAKTAPLAPPTTDAPDTDPQAAMMAPPETLAEQTARQYFRAGSIHRPLEGRFTGLASRRTAKYTELMILYDDGVAPEILHFRNDGTRFYEVR